MRSSFTERRLDAVRFAPRSPVAGVLVSRTTYADATASIVQAACAGVSVVAAATSVHGLTIGATDAEFGTILNSFELVTPDGQPVRWALNLLHGAHLTDRVYGPTLLRWVCEAAAGLDLSVYFYGGRPDVLERLATRLSTRMPGLRVAGYSSPPFRALTPAEDAREVERVRASGAKILFVGLGCPRQERWAYEHRNQLDMPLVCVGAAFDFHAGTLRQAPAWMQGAGLEWLFRTLMEPRRLWRRYAKHIPVFLFLVARQLVTLRLMRLPWATTTIQH
ncbi:MAG: WecB/TagA/CpsF family glycosyltransferase [Chloroflexota bacterium]|nr:WecB/TagA/CpsF family glycosyltransferase [Chloroflexota bacterium]